MAIPVLTGGTILASTINNLGSAASWFSEDTGAANAYKITYSGATPNFNSLTALSNGQIFNFIAQNANSGASTLQVVGSAGTIATPALTKAGGQPLGAGISQAGQMITAISDSADHTRFEDADGGSAGQRDLRGRQRWSGQLDHQSELNPRLVLFELSNVHHFGGDYDQRLAGFLHGSGQFSGGDLQVSGR